MNYQRENKNEDCYSEEDGARDSDPIQPDPPDHVLQKWDFGKEILLFWPPLYPPAPLVHLCIIQTDIPNLGVPMLAMNAPQTTSFNPTDWYFLLLFFFVPLLVLLS